jgi:hypothetical protein
MGDHTSREEPTDSNDIEKGCIQDEAERRG